MPPYSPRSSHARGRIQEAAFYDEVQSHLDDLTAQLDGRTRALAEKTAEVERLLDQVAKLNAENEVRGGGDPLVAGVRWCRGRGVLWGRGSPFLPKTSCRTENQSRLSSVIQSNQNVIVHAHRKTPENGFSFRLTRAS